MFINLENNKYIYFQFFFSITVIFLVFAWQANQGFSLWDEGYLWYGVKRVMLGDVPIRDFMSYDPGRYYWSAWLMKLWDDNGIMSLRRAVAIFQTLGLSVALILISFNNKKNNFLFIVVAAIIFLAWMFPRHKLFDISLSIFLIGILTLLIEKQTTRYYFLAGLFLGIIAVFGRNHGLYGAFGSVCAILWLNINKQFPKEFFSKIIYWLAGLILGFSPVIYMLLVVPGFATAFWDSIRFLFEVKATNLPLPIPWPWNVRFDSLSFANALWGISVGLFFIAIIVFGVGAPAWIVWKKFTNRPVSSVLVATSFLALPYAHYAFSRADVGHLAQGIFPLLIGTLILLPLLPAIIRWLVLIMLAFISVWIVHIYNPWWLCHFSDKCVDIVISHNRLYVDSGTANDVKLLKELNDKYSPYGESFLALPLWPGAYALLDRQSPVWEIYPLFPRSQNFEKIEISKIRAAAPKFAVVIDLPLDTHDELRFKNTHPLTYKYINENYKRTSDSLNSNYEIYLLNEIAK